jgi:hypothetical protein
MGTPAKFDCTTLTVSLMPRRSGVPSRLGRRGGAPACPRFGDVRLVRGEVTILLATFVVDAASIIGRAGDFDAFDGELSAEEVSLNFCDDFLGGGLGGSGDKRFFFFLPLSVFSSFPLPLTVELDEDEVSDSRSAGSPFPSAATVSFSSEALPMRLLVTGGRLWMGLPCRNRGVPLRGTISPGDCEDIEVGVVSLL